VGPMAVSSANRSGLPPATTIEQAREQLADRVGVFLDGGPAGEMASTIVDLTGDDPVVLRQGAVTAAAIGEVLGHPLHVAS
jgi:L-threonylcarbamoyladenylate synthase